MRERMKVMIAYDGSNYADAAIEDLRHAGLPRDSEVLVVSVVDFLLANPSPVSEFDLISLASRRTDAVLRNAKGYRSRVIKEAGDLSAKAVERLRLEFPEWKIRYEILRGKPAAELLQKAAELKPDLIVVGSQGRSAIGRFFLGSVSQKIAEEADCSVRVARRGFEKNADMPTKIIVGASTLPDVERIIEAVGRRVWSDETEVRLVVVDDGVAAGRVSAVYPYAKAIYELSVDELRVVGLQVSVDIKSGNLKSVLLEAAETWEADAIFVVARGEESGLNEAAASLITGANCTVEIVR